MNRSICKMQSDLFKLLSSRTDIDVSAYPKIRAFVTEDEFDSVSKDVCPKSFYQFGVGQLSSIYEYKGNHYLVLPGVFEDLVLSFVTPVNNIKSIDFVHIVTNCIPPLENATETELLTYVFVDPETEDVEWETISRYFPGHATFLINEQIPDDCDDCLIYHKKILISAASQTESARQLPFDNNTISEFITIANTTDNNIPYDNILRSILSYQWKFCFIDLYRCLERLLLCAWVDDFKNTMKTGLPLNDLYNVMVKKYKTEHHEDENINTLFGFLPPVILNSLTQGDSAEAKAKFIYNLRNTIVHYQKSDEVVERKDDSEWNNIICFVLKAIPALYSHLQQYIIDIPEI